MPIDWTSIGNVKAFCSQKAFDKPLIRELARDIFERDKYTCERCEFISRPSRQVFSGYMEIRALDSDYDNLKPENFVTTCPFCHAYDNFDVAISSKRFRVIVAPWITELELSNISRGLLAIVNQKNHLYYAEAVQHYSQFERCEGQLGSVIPCIPTTRDTREENIEHFVRILTDTSNSDIYTNRDRFLYPVRLLPKNKAFSQENNYWYQAVYKHYTVSTWERLLEWKKEHASV